MNKLRKKYIVDEEGQKTEIVLPLDEYESLLEDLHDLAVIAERKNEPAISSEELKKKLHADGFI